MGIILLVNVIPRDWFFPAVFALPRKSRKVSARYFFSRVVHTQLLWIDGSQYALLVHSEHDHVRLHVQGAVVAYFYSDCMYLLARLLYPIPSWFSSTE